MIEIARKLLSRVALAAAFVVGALSFAHAQDTRAQLNTSSNNLFVTCGNGCITPPLVNAYTVETNNSVGFLVDTNAWTGANSFSISPTVPTAPTSDNSLNTASTAFVKNAIATAGAALVNNSTSITGGSAGNILSDNGGTLTEKGVTGSGNVVEATSPVLVTPNLGTPTAINLANATNLPASALPPPTSSTLGGVESYATVAHQWLDSISTAGVPHSSQPAAADLSNGVTGSGAVALANSPTFTGTVAGAAANFSNAINGGIFQTSGVSSGYQFFDRAATGSGWLWYSTGGLARFYDETTPQDVLTVSKGASGTWTFLETTASVSTSSGAVVVNGGLGVVGVVNAQSVQAAAAVGASAANGYYLGSVQTMFTTGNVTAFADPSGAIGFYLGNATDPGDYLQNTHTIFRSRLGAAYAELDATGLTLFGSVSGSELVQVPSAASGTWLLPNANDTIVGNALAATLANKSMSGAANTFTNISLTASVTGVLPFANGGTNANLTANNGGIPYSTVSALAILNYPGSAGLCLLSGQPPTWGSCSGGGGGVTSIAGNSGAFTLTGGITNTGNAIQLSAPVSATLGGSGVASPAAHTLPVNEGASAQNNTGTGNTGQCVVSQGASADPVYVDGCRVKLATLTASNSPTLSDTTHISGAYNDYEIVCDNIVPATNNSTFELQVHTAGAFPVTGYMGNQWEFGSSAGGAQTSAFIQVSPLVQNTGGGYSGKIYGHNLSQAVSPKMWNGLGGHFNGSLINIELFSGEYHSANTAIDGFQLFMGSGNITSGVCKLYGLL